MAVESIKVNNSFVIGVDKEPLIGSTNLVDSDGLAKINIELGTTTDTAFLPNCGIDPITGGMGVRELVGWAIYYKKVTQGTVYRLTLNYNDNGHWLKYGFSTSVPKRDVLITSYTRVDVAYTTFSTDYLAPGNGYVWVNCYIAAGGSCQITEPKISSSVVKLPTVAIDHPGRIVGPDPYYDIWVLHCRQVKKGETYHLIFSNKQTTTDGEGNLQRAQYKRAMTALFPAANVPLISGTYKMLDYPTDIYDGYTYEEYYTVPCDGYLLCNCVVEGYCNISNESDTILKRIENLENTIISEKNLEYLRFKIISWNMEFFGQGTGTTNRITTQELYEYYRPIYRGIFDEVSADFVGICEYEPIFFSGHPEYTTRRELFQYYKSYGEFYKTPDNSSLAFFSHYNITNVVEVAFNQYAPGEYRFYIMGDLVIGTKTIKIIVQHISWQTEYYESQSNQLISDMSSYDYVIIMGDFNSPPSVFEKFKNNGYICANCDYMGSIKTIPGTYQGGAIDNIVVKGGTVTKVEVPNVNEGYDPILSDHYPIICDVIFS